MTDSARGTNEQALNEEFAQFSVGGQRVYVVPSRELVIVRTGAAKTDWDDAIIPNAILRALKPAPAAAAEVAP